MIRPADYVRFTPESGHSDPSNDDVSSAIFATFAHFSVAASQMARLDASLTKYWIIFDG
jgi:hypothetical protein